MCGRIARVVIDTTIAVVIVPVADLVAIRINTAIAVVTVLGVRHRSGGLSAATLWHCGVTVAVIVCIGVVDVPIHRVAVGQSVAVVVDTITHLGLTRITTAGVCSPSPDGHSRAGESSLASCWGRHASPSASAYQSASFRLCINDAVAVVVLTIAVLNRGWVSGGVRVVAVPKSSALRPSQGVFRQHQSRIHRGRGRAHRAAG